MYYPHWYFRLGLGQPKYRETGYMGEGESVSLTIILESDAGASSILDLSRLGSVSVRAEKI